MESNPQETVIIPSMGKLKRIMPVVGIVIEDGLENTIQDTT